MEWTETNTLWFRTLMTTLALPFLLLISMNLHAEDSSDRIFEQEKIDLGEIAKGSKVEFAFPMTNPYEHDLEITRIDSSCGCTSISTSPFTLGPGEKAHIRGEIDTVAYSGRRSAMITVTLSDPDKMEVRLRLQAFIRSDLVLYPDTLRFNDIFAGDVVTKKATLMHAGEPPLQIAKIETKSPWITCQANQSFRKGSQTNFDLTVTVHENAPAGPIREEIVIKILEPEPTSIPFLVTGYLADQLSVSPAFISLGEIELGQKSDINLVVIARKPVVIDAIDSEGWTIETTLSNSRKRTHLIPLRITPTEIPLGSVRSVLRVTTRGEPLAEASAMLTAIISQTAKE